MMWRMTAELNEPVLGGNTMFSAGTGDLKVVGYEISATAKTRGRSLFNWIAEARAADVDAPLPEREDWNRGAKIADFIGRFKEMEFDWFDPTDVAKESSSAWAFPMVDRDPVDRWAFGRVTLFGDAAHPMWPIGFNDASQSGLDCRALTSSIVDHSTIEEALIAYE
jgi:5-methylphenazine-1-carboxylate 1-monooxygenase